MVGRASEGREGVVVDTAKERVFGPLVAAQHGGRETEHWKFYHKFKVYGSRNKVSLPRPQHQPQRRKPVTTIMLAQVASVFQVYRLRSQETTRGTRSRRTSCGPARARPSSCSSWDSPESSDSSSEVEETIESSDSSLSDSLPPSSDSLSSDALSLSSPPSSSMRTNDFSTFIFRTIRPSSFSSSLGDSSVVELDGPIVRRNVSTGGD